jgi:hypothetical protein
VSPRGPSAGIHSRREPPEELGGTVSYAALAAKHLGWHPGILTAAGRAFDPGRDLPGVEVFVAPAAATTRFRNVYGDDGPRRQELVSRSDPIDLTVLPESWRAPEALLLGPVAGELGPGAALAFQAGVVAWPRRVPARVRRRGRRPRGSGATPARDLEGAHVCSCPNTTCPTPRAARTSCRRWCPSSRSRAAARLRLFTRDGVQEVATPPRPEKDPTGPATFSRPRSSCATMKPPICSRRPRSPRALLRAPWKASGFPLGDREEVCWRQQARERLVEDGEDE